MSTPDADSAFLKNERKKFTFAVKNNDKCCRCCFSEEMYMHGRRKYMRKTYLIKENEEENVCRLDRAKCCRVVWDEV